MLKLDKLHAEPFITLDEVKSNLRVLEAEEDQLIERLILTACTYVQEVSGLRLNEDHYNLTLSQFERRIAMPVSPVLAVNFIQYYDAHNDFQLIEEGLFSVTNTSQSSILSSGQWPETFQRDDAITINFVTGYPHDLMLPENLRHAAILLASHWFEHRTPAGAKLDHLPYGIEHLINLSRASWYV